MVKITEFLCSNALEYISFHFGGIRYICESPVSNTDYSEAFMIERNKTLNYMMSFCEITQINGDYVAVNYKNTFMLLKRNYSYVELYHEPEIRKYLLWRENFQKESFEKETKKNNETQVELKKETETKIEIEKEVKLEKETETKKEELENEKEVNYIVQDNIAQIEKNKLLKSLCLIYAELYKEKSYYFDNDKSFSIILKHYNITIVDLFNYLIQYDEINIDKRNYIICLFLIDRIDMPENERPEFILDRKYINTELINMLINFNCELVKYDNNLIYDTWFMNKFMNICMNQNRRHICISNLAEMIFKKPYDFVRGFAGLKLIANYALIFVKKI
jgi:hypothetical protein